jgi:hypothetical protein
MYLTLTNITEEPEAAATPDGAFAIVLHSHTPTSFNQEAEGVLVIGDKPDLRETVEQAAGALEQLVRDLVHRILGRKRHAEQRTGKPEDVRVVIANHGANPVRVILGDGVRDVEVPPGSQQTCSASGYLELRELGLVQADPNQIEAP